MSIKSEDRNKQDTQKTSAMFESDNDENLVDSVPIEPPVEEECADDHHASKHNNNMWGRGVVADFKRTLGTHYKAEMTNINQTVVACSFFLFFACIAPAITFGKHAGGFSHQQSYLYGNQLLNFFH